MSISTKTVSKWVHMKSLVGATVGLLSLVGVFGTSVSSFASGVDSIKVESCPTKAVYTMADMHNVVSQMEKQIKNSKVVSFDTYEKMGYAITFLEKKGEQTGMDLKSSDRFAFTKGKEKFFITMILQGGRETVKGEMDTICGK